MVHCPPPSVNSCTDMTPAEVVVALPPTHNAPEVERSVVDACCKLVEAETIRAPLVEKRPSAAVVVAKPPNQTLPEVERSVVDACCTLVDAETMRAPFVEKRPSAAVVVAKPPNQTLPEKVACPVVEAVPVTERLPSVAMFVLIVVAASVMPTTMKSARTAGKRRVASHMPACLS